MIEKTVLFVDDENSVLKAIERYLIREPYRKLFAAGAAEALEILKNEQVCLIVSDIRMPGMNGLELLKIVCERYPDVVRMVLSGTSESQLVIDAINNGEVYRYLTKPLGEGSELRTILAQALEYYELRRLHKQLFAELAEKNKELSEWKQRMARELQVAGEVQRKLLAAQPVNTTNYDVRFFYQPCLTVGGDFFDIIQLPDGRLCVYVGDVSGHGVGSALISTLLKMTLSDMIHAYIDEGPAAICRRLNSYMHEHAMGMDFFATMFLAVYDPATSCWQAFNCGHPVPDLVGADTELKSGLIPDDRTFPLGFFNEPAHYSRDIEIKWQAQKGDMLFFFTDGLYEAMSNTTGKILGFEKMAAIFESLVKQTGGLPDAQEILRIIDDSGYDTGRDDCCVILVRI
ncbi:MAG: response regulator receiver modulated serine phosphatase [uncultured bacterium]|nr:MAG: response regulator receiver modulated serine phosphatase [uncultured bacterium]